MLRPTFQAPAGPLLLQLGKTHSATLVGKWLFDANHPRALPADGVTETAASLDTICLKASGKPFSHVARGVLLTAGKSTMKNIRKRKRVAEPA